MPTRNHPLLSKAGGTSCSPKVPQVAKPASHVAFVVTEASPLCVSAPSREKFSHAQFPARPSTGLVAGATFLARRALFFSFAFLFLLLFLSSTPSASACGISWHLPETPLSDSEECRFQYWTSEFEPVKVPGVARYKTSDEELAIPLHIGFIPTSTYNSPIGYGFEFALFDSRLVWINDRKVKMHMPNGDVKSLTFDKRKNTLSGGGRLARSI